MVTCIAELQIIRNAVSLLHWKGKDEVLKVEVKELLDKVDAELERKRSESSIKSSFNPEYGDFSPEPFNLTLKEG